jgi:integrase
VRRTWSGPCTNCDALAAAISSSCSPNDVCGSRPARCLRAQPAAIEQLKAKAQSPQLGELVDPVLPRGRGATLADLTQGFISEYRRTRVRAVGGRRRLARPDVPLSPATLNRDLAALGAFLTWARDVERLAVDRPKLPREREGRGRERWLSSEELARFEAKCAADWWPLFATLFYTGARLGEVQGLRGADVLVHASGSSFTRRTGG